MTKTILKIDGMMCGMCEAHVNDAVRRGFDVKKVRSSHKSGCCEIISSAPLDKEKLYAAVEETGYHVLGVTEEPYTSGFSRLFSHQ